MERYFAEQQQREREYATMSNKDEIRCFGLYLETFLTL